MDFVKHRQIAEENLAIWREKPLLREVYKGFFLEISRCLQKAVSGPTVELGAGVCGIKEVIPDCICTDQFESTGVDQVESVYDLSFAPESVVNFIMIDVFHHLQFPFAALEKLRQKLVPGGRVIIFEPAISLLGLLVYGVFHDEPVALFRPIDQREFGVPDVRSDFYAAQGNASRIFSNHKYQDNLNKWELVDRKRYAGVSYVASGGFKKRPLYSHRYLPAMKKLDAFMDKLPSMFATRQMIVLEKRIYFSTTPCARHLDQDVVGDPICVNSLEQETKCSILGASMTSTSERFLYEGSYAF